MKYSKDNPILTASDVKRLSKLETQTLTCFGAFVTGDPEGTPEVEPVHLEHEAVMIYEDAKGARRMDAECELAVLRTKFNGFHAARALPAGVVKVQLLSLENGIVNCAHPFVKDGPIEFFEFPSRNEARRMPI